MEPEPDAPGPKLNYFSFAKLIDDIDLTDDWLWLAFIIGIIL